MDKLIMSPLTSEELAEYGFVNETGHTIYKLEYQSDNTFLGYIAYVDDICQWVFVSNGSYQYTIYEIKAIEKCINSLIDYDIVEDISEVLS